MYQFMQIMVYFSRNPGQNSKEEKGTKPTFYGLYADRGRTICTGCHLLYFEDNLRKMI